LRGSMGTGTKEDESSTGRVWAAEFHHVTAHSRLACVLRLMNHLFLSFSKFFSSCSKLRILGSACIYLQNVACQQVWIGVHEGLTCI